MRKHWMQMAVDLAVENVDSGTGGPFGAVVVKGDELVATGVNMVTATQDPSAHAEVVAIRAACRMLGDFQLTGCELYTSCEPCPMCLGAIYWARLERYFFAGTRCHAAEVGFDDEFIYREMALPPHARSIPGELLLPDAGRQAFARWLASASKISY
jgi:tRNA(Arg) A34 adenosine deaminase TadA